MLLAAAPSRAACTVESVPRNERRGELTPVSLIEYTFQRFPFETFGFFLFTEFEKRWQRFQRWIPVNWLPH